MDLCYLKTELTYFKNENYFFEPAHSDLKIIYSPRTQATGQTSLERNPIKKQIKRNRGGERFSRKPA